MAPNSPGDGANDILILGWTTIFRSTDAGATWKQDAVWLHVDHRIIAFAPTRPVPGTVPVTYVGCDGGVGKSTRLADPTVTIDTPLSSGDFNETATPPQDSHVWQNCNRGRQSVDFEGYTAPNGYPALSYIASWDSGIKGGAGATWRGLWDRDSQEIAAAVGAGGVVIWSWLDIGANLNRWVDVGDFNPANDQPTLNGGNATPTGSPVVESSGACLVGVATQGLTVVARIPQQGNAVQISQDFRNVGLVRAIAVDPSNKDVLYCLTKQGVQPKRLWMTTAASTASATTVWTEITTGTPSGQDPFALAVSLDGTLYVGMNFYPGQAPLYAIVSGALCRFSRYRSVSHDSFQRTFSEHPKLLFSVHVLALSRRPRDRQTATSDDRVKPGRQPTFREANTQMTTREVLIRLPIAAMLLVAIGAVGNLGTNQGLFVQQTPPRVQELPHFRFDWPYHQWVQICGPFPSEICA